MALCAENRPYSAPAVGRSVLSTLAAVCCGQVFHDELGGRREAISDAISRCSRLLQETTSSEADDIRARYLSLPLSLSVCVSVSSCHTLLEHICVHNQAPVFSRGCLLRCLGRTNVQWSQIPFSGSEPRVVGSAKFFNTVYVCTVCFCLAACWRNTR